MEVFENIGKLAMFENRLAVSIGSATEFTLREVEGLTTGCFGCSANNQQPALVPVFQGVLGDEFRRNGKVEVGEVH